MNKLIKYAIIKIFIIIIINILLFYKKEVNLFDN